VLVGAICGLRSAVSAGFLLWLALALTVAGWTAWWANRDRATVGALATALFCAAAALSADARDRALHTPVREWLNRELGGFAIETPGPGARHDPLPVRAILREDASRTGDVTTLRAVITAVGLRDDWHDTHGTVLLSVGGTASHAQADEWRAGRTIETSVAFRRPTRYLNEGIPDAERALALSGVTLFGSIKSALLVRVTGRGSGLQEGAARIRQGVRERVERWVGRHDAVSAAIVTAVLIGDRSGLPGEVRLRLQAAGTYHVIAISGGNIAILVGLVLALFYVCGRRGRVAVCVTLCLLVAYAQVVTAGPSVWR
jgi:competence protein ComEC